MKFLVCNLDCLGQLLFLVINVDNLIALFDILKYYFSFILLNIIITYK